MKPRRSIKLDANDRRILLNTCYGHFMSHFNMLVFPALVLPLMARLGMEMAQVLSLSFWMYLLFGGATVNRNHELAFWTSGSLFMPWRWALSDGLSPNVPGAMPPRVGLPATPVCPTPELSWGNKTTSRCN